MQERWRSSGGDVWIRSSGGDVWIRGKNACESTLSFVKVGSSDQFGCYKMPPSEKGPQCWRKCTSGEDWCPRDHEWCNIYLPQCTKSRAVDNWTPCAKPEKYDIPATNTYDESGSICVKDWKNKYCDFRTGKRYGCHKGHSTCWRTCDEETDEMCSSEGWCYAYSGPCTTDWGCLVATTNPCTA